MPSDLDGLQSGSTYYTESPIVDGLGSCLLLVLLALFPTTLLAVVLVAAALLLAVVMAVLVVFLSYINNNTTSVTFAVSWFGIAAKVLLRKYLNIFH